MRLKLILDARMPLGIRHFWFKICFPFLCFVRTALRPASFDLAFLLTVLRPSHDLCLLYAFLGAFLSSGPRLRVLLGERD